MKIRKYSGKDKSQIVELIALFRVELRNLKSIPTEPDIISAEKELQFYLENEYPIYIAEQDNQILAYCVIRIFDNVVWEESLYVISEARRTGIGSKLFKKAEDIAKSYGNDTLYNWVHPNNQKSIEFLKKQGYEVLNLIELRKKRGEENLDQILRVGENDFKY